MRRQLSLLCLGALAASGLAVSAPAAAAPAPAPQAPQASPTAAAAVPDELLVGYVDGASPADRDRARGRADAAKQEQVVRGEPGRSEVELVRLPAGKDRGRAIAELESDPAVAYAEPNWIYTHQAGPKGKPGSGTTTTTLPTYGTAGDDVVTDPDFTSGGLWGMYGSGSSPKNDFGANAAAAWATGARGSQDIVIGVIDEGVDPGHLGLVGQVANRREVAANNVDDDGNGHVDDVHGWDFVENNNSVYDGTPTTLAVDSHGTHVSGTIGAKADDLGVVGVNHAVSIVNAKFLGPEGGTTADAVKAVDYFTDLKVLGKYNVVATNNSWGGGGYSTPLFEAIVRGAKADILFIAAAGNTGSNNDRRASYPANYDTTSALGHDVVIAVAAIDSKGALASFSQYGAKTVDLGAPGVGILSTVPGGQAAYNGTSMATPHVTGAAALYAARYPGAKAAAIRSALLTGTVPTASLSGKTATGGRLDIAGALTK